ncbi:MAG: hypothetical protein MK095_04625 [Phycisphaerales bacterium]|nr:hypothetical protein [Phycisphaerales bacterium]
MMRLLMTCTVLTAALLAGCESKAPEQAAAPAAAVTIPTSTFMSERPTDVSDLLEVKKNAKVGDNVVFLARVGGRVKPFVKTQAIFVVADPSLKSCELMADDDHCSVPWDYCCEDGALLRDGMATICIRGEDGRPLKVNAQGAGGLEAAKFVVIEGIVNDLNDEGVFIVDANSIWVGGKPTYQEPMKGSM